MGGFYAHQQILDEQAVVFVVLLTCGLSYIIEQRRRFAFDLEDKTNGVESNL